MFSTKKSVKIIGRKHRELHAAERHTSRSVKTERQVKREMAQKVASWIEERREVVKERDRSDSARSQLVLNATPCGE